MNRLLKKNVNKMIGGMNAGVEGKNANIIPVITPVTINPMGVPE